MISVIIPMYNEEENVNYTIDRVREILRKNYSDYEIIAVDDGSQDETGRLLDNKAAEDEHVKILRHQKNKGMGRALKTGFNAARGDIIVTLDADLSYDPIHIPELVKETGNADIVIGSQYMPEGSTENVPLHRLVLSRLANRIIGLSMKKNLNTVTGVFRAYRKDVINSMELESDGTEINPEILVKANALGYRIREVPVKLKGRERGESKIRIKSAILSHLLFAFNEKPMLLFGIAGALLCITGILSGLYLFILYLNHSLDPTRPLMTFMLLTLLSGIQILFFGFIATQVSMLRKEIYLIQRDLKLMRASSSEDQNKAKDARYQGCEDL